MRISQRINIIVAVVMWLLASVFMLSNIFGWESAWHQSGYSWVIVAQIHLITLIWAMNNTFMITNPAEKKKCLLRNLIVLVISTLVSVPTLFVFSSWNVLG